MVISDVARVTEISARSPNSFEDAISRASDPVVEYQVNPLVSFVLE